MKKLRNIIDFLKLNGKYILFLLPIVLHQVKILDLQIASNFCLAAILWCMHRYIFSVYKYEDKKMDYVFFGALTFYLSYVEFSFSLFSILVALHFIFQKIRLKKYWALGLFWFGAAGSIGLCIHQYDLTVATDFFHSLWLSYPAILPEIPQGYIFIFVSVVVFLTGLLHRFYMVIALAYLWISLATGTQSLIISAILIALLSFAAIWKIEKRIA
jgi:hypothetical protein